MTSDLHKFKSIYRYVYKSTRDLTHLKKEEESSFDDAFNEQKDDFMN